MAIPTKEPELIFPESQAVATRPADYSSTFERMASDPNIDVAKLEKLMEMNERMLARTAREQFNAAMSSAQKEMRPVAADADNPQTRSRYASYAALDRALRPIYTNHGFGLSYDTGETAAEQCVRVLCYVTHCGGHDHTYHIDMPADGKGAKGGDVMTKTHATGAAMSYGMRYLLKMIFNVAVGEDDRDGNDPPQKAMPPEPSGFDKWWDDIAAVADNGTAALETAWKGSKAEFRTHVFATNRPGWSRLKAKAEAVK